jgi:hypothetical protein
MSKILLRFMFLFVRMIYECTFRHAVFSLWYSSFASPTLSSVTYCISCGAKMSGPVEHRQCNILLLRCVALRSAAVAAAAVAAAAAAGET